ncbi:MAG: dipeptidase, partial [Calditrichaeota bacterium]|nr:dipeptidase [Calditrichota bacterium]
MSNAAINYFEQHYNEHLQQLIELARIPSCSWAGFDPKFVLESADYTAKLMRDCGLEHVEVIKLDGAH